MMFSDFIRIQLQAECQRAAEQFLRERARLIERERERRAAVLAQQVALFHQQVTNQRQGDSAVPTRREIIELVQGPDGVWRARP